MSEVAATPSAPAEQASAPESVQGDIDSKSDPSSQPTALAAGKIKVKIDGKEMTISQSALKTIAAELGTSEEAFIRDFGTSANATRKTQEIAKLRREVEADKARLQEDISRLKSDPKVLWQLAKELGHDPEALAEERVWEKIQYEKLSPEKREALAEKQRADAAEQRLKDLEAAENEKTSKAASQAAEQEIEQDVMKVLELTKRKAEPALIRRVAEIYESYMLAKKTKPSHEYVVNKLRDLRRQEFAEDLAGTDIEELMNNLPQDFISKFQSHLVSKARSRDLPSHTPSGSAPSQPKAKSERVTIDQFFKNL